MNGQPILGVWNNGDLIIFLSAVAVFTVLACEAWYILKHHESEPKTYAEKLRAVWHRVNVIGTWIAEINRCDKELDDYLYGGFFDGIARENIIGEDSE
jgi:hypothetical protein